jgi:hypothetical protein
LNNLKQTNMHWVYKIEWTEYEPGWGCRPDGCSYHETKEAADEFIKEHLGKITHSKSADYSRPGTPNLVEVDDSMYHLIKMNNVWWTTDQPQF